jgi:chromosome segregation ATPase|tara:strand:+ start:54 stop:350 length:297 start_codon:yes stop_codon:yes gene_type:complete
MGTMTNADRLDRIEEKIDKMSDAIVSIARAEEKISGLESLTVDLHRKLTDLEERLRKVEDIASQASSELKVINKVFWIAITTLITGGIAMVVFGTPAF